MKKIFTILALSLGVMSVSAEDIKGNSYFIGGNVGVTNSKVNLQNDKLKDLSLRLGLDVGYIINDEWRTYLGYKFTTKAKDALRNNVDAKISDQHQVHFGVDYTPRFIGSWCLFWCKIRQSIRRCFFCKDKRICSRCKNWYSSRSNR